MSAKIQTGQKAEKAEEVAVADDPKPKEEEAEHPRLTEEAWVDGLDAHVKIAEAANLKPYLLMAAYLKKHSFGLFDQGRAVLADTLDSFFARLEGGRAKAEKQ